MKKSLIILSISLIFLLSITIVSASWFNELFSEKSTGQAVKVTGDVQQVRGFTQVPGAKTEVSQKTTNAFSRTSSQPSSASSARTSSSEISPGRRWEKTIDINGDICWKRGAGKKSLFSRA